jgi:hypothetical protein
MLPCGNNSYSIIPLCAAFTASGLLVKNEPTHIFLVAIQYNICRHRDLVSPELLAINVKSFIFVSA